MIDFSKIYQLKGLKLHKKGRMNIYEHCVLTEKKHTRYITHASNIQRIKTPCRNAIKVFMSICTISWKRQRHKHINGPNWLVPKREFALQEKKQCITLLALDLSGKKCSLLDNGHPTPWLQFFLTSESEHEFKWFPRHKNRPMIGWHYLVYQ